MGLIAGFILRECLSVRHSDKIPLTIGFISYFVTIAGLGVTNIFQPDKSKHYSVAAQAACAFITAFSLGCVLWCLFGLARRRLADSSTTGFGALVLP